MLLIISSDAKIRSSEFEKEEDFRRLKVFSFCAFEHCYSSPIPARIPPEYILRPRTHVTDSNPACSHEASLTLEALLFYDLDF